MTRHGGTRDKGDACAAVGAALFFDGSIYSSESLHIGSPPSGPTQRRRCTLPPDSLQCATAAFSPPHPNLQEVAICFGERAV